MKKIKKIIFLIVITLFILTACSVNVNDCVLLNSGGKICFQGVLEYQAPKNFNNKDFNVSY